MKAIQTPSNFQEGGFVALITPPMSPITLPPQEELYLFPQSSVVQGVAPNNERTLGPRKLSEVFFNEQSNTPSSKLPRKSSAPAAYRDQSQFLKKNQEQFQHPITEGPEEENNEDGDDAINLPNKERINLNQTPLTFQQIPTKPENITIQGNEDGSRRKVNNPGSPINRRLSKTYESNNIYNSISLRRGRGVQLRILNEWISLNNNGQGAAHSLPPSGNSPLNPMWDRSPLSGSPRRFSVAVFSSEVENTPPESPSSRCVSRRSSTPPSVSSEIGNNTPKSPASPSYAKRPLQNPAYPLGSPVSRRSSTSVSSEIENDTAKFPDSPRQSARRTSYHPASSPLSPHSASRTSSGSALDQIEELRYVTVTVFSESTSLTDFSLLDSTSSVKFIEPSASSRFEFSTSWLIGFSFLFACFF